MEKKTTKRITPKRASGFVSPGEDFEKSDISDFIPEYLIPRPAATFYFWACEDSMAPLVNRGDLVLVDRSLRFSSGDLCVVNYLGEFLLRRVIKKGESVLLRAEKKTTREVLIEQAQDFEIFGVVSFIVRPFKKALPWDEVNSSE